MTYKAQAQALLRRAEADAIDIDKESPVEREVRLAEEHARDEIEWAAIRGINAPDW